MQGKYKVITLCGSTKFKDEFLEVQKRLTLEGNIVISVGLFGHSGDNEVWTDGTKEMLDDMHRRKIDMADEIFVINKNGYIGTSTKSEIAYAMSKGIPVRYMENSLILHPEYCQCSYCGDYVYKKTMTRHLIDMNDMHRRMLNLFYGPLFYVDVKPIYAEYHLCPICESEERSPMEVKFLRKGYLL